jgi:hypothetical protein
MKEDNILEKNRQVYHEHLHRITNQTFMYKEYQGGKFTCKEFNKEG